MLHNAYKNHFRGAILATQRCTLFTTYFITWNPKLRRAIALDKQWNMRAFQGLNIFAASIILPSLLVRCVQLSNSPKGVDDQLTLYLTYLICFILPSYLCYARILMRPEGSRKLIHGFEIMFTLEETLEGWLTFVCY